MSIFDSIKLESTAEKGGYGIGLQIGQQLADSAMQVSAEAVAKGIYDVLNQNKPAIALEEVSKALQQIQQQAQEAANAQFKQIEQEGRAFLVENAKKDNIKVTETGLQYEVITEGNGNKPTRQDSVRVHYTGKLINGTTFDSSVVRGTPAEFPVSGVIAGWTEALQLMPVGSKWRLTIPHNLAYGERGAGQSIPPFSVLVFEVELLDIL
ncbi:peptidylprolyl isomerase [Lonepinella koalarum]|uniref:Peptidyl-prolyl cis-trans isomerase n=1 Tax=Lonepinella koalarum TaxID=53417 RepID=A0A4R1KYA8_9PAST|nr:FKBP-type peptidyl-prolyl cis-trans isomerase [Lonepinella koalarum]MDH2926513.1 peptidylprolyl isomerase [Lonepinella koalarum]TCK69550.1 FKBP-type peptidyl-prolyl cis-trans isomerase FklB [Lonepinella koalarum]TFJ89794.1 peptidylprolyl isomerase [Lonepinella koalarum]TYG34067.1 peptidylprolyl isomerase [Lonepinella koalarum]